MHAITTTAAQPADSAAAAAEETSSFASTQRMEQTQTATLQQSADSSLHSSMQSQQQQQHQQHHAPLDRALSEELRAYELKVIEKQKRIIQQFEETARTSRSEVVSVESSRVSTELAGGVAEGSLDPSSVGQQLSAHMTEFEATLDREIEAQREQLMHTLATNRAQKIEAQLRELRSRQQQMQMQQQQQAQQQQQHVSFSTIAGSPSANASSHSSSSIFSAQPSATYPQQQPTASPAHRYEYRAPAATSAVAAAPPTVTRVDHTPARSAAVSPARSPERPSAQVYNKYAPAPAAPSAAAPGSKHVPSPPRAAVSALKQEDPIRAQWLNLQAELHGPSRSPSASNLYKPSSSASASASALSSVSASSPSAGPQAATAANMSKLESALEMDWDSVWSELETTNKPSVGAFSHTGYELTQPQAPSAPSAQYAYHPPAQQQQPTQPKHIVSGQSRSPSRDRARAQPSRAVGRTPMHSSATNGAASANTTLNRSVLSTAAPVQVLQQASSLFNRTLHELEERAEYLTTLIAAFKDAGREMEETILQQSMAHNAIERQQQHHPHSHPQPQHQQSHYQQQHEDQYDSQPEQQHAPVAAEPPRPSQRRRSAQPSQQRSASRPRVAFAPPAPAQPSRPRSASVAPASRSSNGSALNRSASSTTVTAAAAAAAPKPVAAPPRRPVSASASSAAIRPASAAPAARAAAAPGAASIRRPVAAPAAGSYPRPRTASARAARSKPDPGVAAAQARIRAIMDKTRPARGRGVSVQTHPHVPRPRDVLLEEPRAKGGVRQASVQEVLRGAEDIAARKSTPVALRPKPGQQVPSSSSAATKRTRSTHKDPADEYDFEPSSDAHPHHPLSLVAAAKMQRASTERLQSHAGVPSHAVLAAAATATRRNSSVASAPAPAQPQQPHPDDEFGTLMSEVEPSLLDDSHDGDADASGVNTTAGLIKQASWAQVRHGGQLEEYLKALALPSHSEERRLALERLAAKARAQPAPIYASPLRTHSAQALQARAASASMALAAAQGHGAERFNTRADAIIRGSHANDAPPPDRVQRVGGLVALQQIMNAHHVQAPVPV